MRTRLVCNDRDGCRIELRRRVTDTQTAEVEFGPPLRCIWPGQSFGELALLQRDATRTATVVAGICGVASARETLSSRQSCTSGSARPSLQMRSDVSASAASSSQGRAESRHGVDGGPAVGDTAASAIGSDPSELLASSHMPNPAEAVGGPVGAVPFASADAGDAGSLQQRNTRSTGDEHAWNSFGADLLRVPRTLFDSAVTAHHVQQLEERLLFLAKFAVRELVPTLRMTLPVPMPRHDSYTHISLMV